MRGCKGLQVIVVLAELTELRVWLDELMDLLEADGSSSRSQALVAALDGLSFYKQQVIITL